MRRRPLRWLARGFAVSLVGAALLAPACHPGGRPPGSGVSEPEGDARALDLVLFDVNPSSPTHGVSMRLSEVWAEHGVVLNFMASWCAPCRFELPELQALAESSDVPIVCVASAEAGDDEALLAMLEKMDLDLPVLYAPPDRVEEIDRHYRHEIVPTTYLVDGTGRIRLVLEGYQDRSYLEMRIVETFGS